ncbi:amidohydrolase family protein [Paremcibacter congregatus]|uniref:Amidohydrolase n=1 Tax=Paremcibacter congregatus TaxID=2043170 RepID=A0A2G4YT35_9PROT|nr:amidohydrolase family protein [Paremcibacter congregatus]PHZ85495.1 amidohydrolase [Paremcibacter congregatus]QDE27630.1 amidohydrolase family protein [Paremcibacter congregatus]
MYKIYRNCGVMMFLLAGFLYPSLVYGAEPGELVASWIEEIGVPKPKDLPPRGDEGEGPFEHLIIKDVFIIDGTGAPAYGPATVTIEKDRIVGISRGEHASYYKNNIKGGVDTKVIDGKGMYLLPGFIDSHFHYGSGISAYFGKLNDPEYVAKLTLGHGITTVREVAAIWGLNWMVRHKKRSDAGEITAPRLVVYPQFPGLMELKTPMQARKWVRTVHKRGAEGIKFARNEFDTPMDMYKAAIEEAKALDMEISDHHSIDKTTTLDVARLGVNSSEHFSGLPQAMRTGGTIKKYPVDYVNGQYEKRLKGDEAYFWGDTAQPGSQKWHQTIAELIELDHTLVPTLAILGDRRDMMALRQAEWHDQFTMPYLMKAFEPNPKIHGSGTLDWTTDDELIQRRNTDMLMQFVDDFKNAGGRVAAGSDAGYIYMLYGFGFVRELEYLREAGFHPLEVIQSATLKGAELMNMEKDLGSIEVGKKADMVLISENPLTNLKVLYGTGHRRFNFDSSKMERVGGVKYTIKDGIVWDAKQLLVDVRKLVAGEKSK